MPPTPPSISAFADTGINAIRVNISNGENVSRNDVYRRDSKNPDWLLLGSVGTSQQYIDREAASQITYTYRVTAVAADESTANSNEASSSVNIGEWLIIDLQDPEDSISAFIDNDPLSIGTSEHQAKFNPIGRKYPLVIKDKFVKGAEFDINMQFTTEEEFLAFEKLREKQKILLLQSPMPGRQWYFVFDSSGNERVFDTTTPYRHFNIGIIEVGRPEA